MHKLSFILLATVMTACATPRPHHADLGLYTHTPELSTSAPESFAAPSPPKGDNWIGNSYTALKVGSFQGAGDLSNQNTGLYSELIFGRELLSFLAIEGVAGYMQADGPAFDIWGVPLFVQARFSMPILVVEPYIGAGVGGFYADISSSNAALTSSEFVAAANAFIGIEMGLGNLALGVEAKYIATEEFNSNFAVEGSSVMISATLPF